MHGESHLDIDPSVEYTGNDSAFTVVGALEGLVVIVKGAVVTLEVFLGMEYGRENSGR
jgi:hypothetical protein